MPYTLPEHFEFKSFENPSSRLVHPNAPGGEGDERWREEKR